LFNEAEQTDDLGPQTTPHNPKTMANLFRPTPSSWKAKAVAHGYRLAFPGRRGFTTCPRKKKLVPVVVMPSTAWAKNAASNWSLSRPASR